MYLLPKKEIKLHYKYSSKSLFQWFSKKKILKRLILFSKRIQMLLPGLRFSNLRLTPVYQGYPLQWFLGKE